MSAPFEIMALNGLQAWVAPQATTKPLVDTTPAAPWVLLGANGTADYDEGGVSVKHTDTKASYMGLGTTGPIKTWRTQEGLEVDLTLNDMRLESLQVALNNQAITTTAAGTGIPGSKSMPLLQGYSVATWALLLRGNTSPYGDGFNVQYWVPAVWQDNDPEPKAVKGVPMGLHMTFKALQDLVNGFGVYEAQNALHQ